MSEIQIKSHDHNQFSAYMAMPEQTPAPCIILIQEIFGVNEEMRRKCDDYAAKGYVAIAPDLFWRLERDVRLTDKTQEEWDKAFDLMNRFDIDLGIKDLDSTLEAMLSADYVNGHAGCIGYCLGGKLSFLMACRTNVDAAVSFYGVGLEGLLGEAENIRNPVLIHIAEEDQFVSKDAQEQIKAGLAANPQVQVYSYPGVNHAFARGQGQHYDENAATLANSRTEEFLYQKLKRTEAA